MYRNTQGYSAIKVLVDGKQIEVLEHRLNALLNNPLKEVLCNDVHHQNGIRWDNSLDNLELLSRDTHLKKHSNPTGNGNLINGENCKGYKNPAKRQDVRKKMSESSKKHFPTIFKNGKNRNKQAYGIRYEEKILTTSTDLVKLSYYFYAICFNLKYTYLGGL